MKNEIWKPIPGFNKYWVSNYGRVKNINLRNTGKESIVQPFYTCGYKRVKLWDGEKDCKKLVHILVAQAFVEIPERLKGIPMSKLDVHHINFSRTDNRPENLCWLTKVEHMALHHSTPIEQLSPDGEVIKEWSSFMEIERSTKCEKYPKGFSASLICRMCRGKNGTAYGSKWRYKKPVPIQ